MKTLAAYAAILLFAVAQANADEAKDILQATGINGGLIVHLGCGDGTLTAALHADDSFLVHGLDADVTAARRHIQSLGLYGLVSVEQWAGDRLPYADNLVNLIVADNLGKLTMDEVMRVLAPNGVALIAGKKIVKPWPKEIDEWTHFLHGSDNNAVAHDTLVGPPKSMQWVAEPLYCRTHEIDSSISALVSARGRLFYILDEGPMGLADQRLPEKWALVARDAFNGVLLWKQPLPHWGWPEWKRDLLAGKDWVKVSAQRLNFPAALPKRLVADGDKLYVTFGFHAPVSQVDAGTGAILHTYAGTENADEIVVRDGILVICVRTNTGSGPSDAVLAVEAGTGRILWKLPKLHVTPLSLAASAGHVVFDNQSEIVCLDQKTGQPLWRKPSQGLQVKQKNASREGVVEGWQWHESETLVVQNGIVLSMDKDLEAISLETGKTLWQKSSGAKGARYNLAPDLFVAGGLVWYGVGEGGFDLRTGAIKRKIDVMNLLSVGHHPRCYPSKATDRYLIEHKQGAEFIDLLGGNKHMRNDWMRGPCRYGVLPCNGLLYAAPHQCKCYVGVKLNGFNALTAQATPVTTDQLKQNRLEQGPACAGFALSAVDASAADDWPTLRHDPARSGSAKTPVPASIKPMWQAKLGVKLSQPVIADGRLLVAALDAQQVRCFEAKTGKPLWQFTAGGRVDSPPTVFRGAVLFGCGDGWVYCLRAADGELVWRFRAAPVERRVVAMGAIESTWPVHGSVLVQGGVAYVAAGRSTFLDGGIFLYALDPATGNQLHDARLEGPYPDIAHDPGGSGFMNGAISDVLVGDGKFVYLRQVKYDESLRLAQPANHYPPRDAHDVGLHLMASSSLLDGSGFNRVGLTYGRTWPISQGAPVLVFSSTTIYDVQPFTKHQGQSQVYFPATGCIQLSAQRFDVSAEAARQPTKRGKKSAGVAGPGNWSMTIPVRARAMVLAGQTLFMAGPPDVLDPKDPLAAFEGRHGAELWAISAADGKRLAQWKLDSEPVFDGMITAGGCLFFSTTDGSVGCMGEKPAAP